MTFASLNNDTKMPMFGLGTWNSAPGAVKVAVYTALKAGYRHIDCASMYGNEAEVGAGLKQAFDEGICAREDVFVTSKLAVNKQGDGDVAPSLQQTLLDLQLDYVDLYLIHWPFGITGSFPPKPEEILTYTPERYLGIWRQMEAVYELKQARAIGVSNMTAKKIAALLPEARVRPAVNQVELHPMLAQPALVEYCKSEGIVLTAYSPMGSPGRPERLRADDDPVLLELPLVKDMAAAKGVDPACILLRWGMQRGVVVIPKSVTPARIESNLRATEIELTDDEMAALNGLDKGHRLLKGTTFCTEGQTWQQLWDEE